mmetsp:Transcript_49783/g.130975  ORF Transcript_49783/g.130975 Transcript_49783/m.130975 type:complete len:543 (+) Transcript_49783:373-2001(+)
MAGAGHGGLPVRRHRGHGGDGLRLDERHQVRHLRGARVVDHAGDVLQGLGGHAPVRELEDLGQDPLGGGRLHGAARLLHGLRRHRRGPGGVRGVAVQDLRPLRLRQRHRRDQGDPERLRHQEVPGGVDAHHQESGSGALRRVGPQHRQGGPLHPRVLLRRQRRLPPLQQVQDQRGQEARAAVVRGGGGGGGGLRRAHRGGPLLAGGGVVLLPAAHHVALALLRHHRRHHAAALEPPQLGQARHVRGHVPPPVEAVRARPLHAHRGHRGRGGGPHQQVQRQVLQVPQVHSAQEVAHHRDHGHGADHVPHLLHGGVPARELDAAAVLALQRVQELVAGHLRGAVRRRQRPPDPGVPAALGRHQDAPHHHHLRAADARGCLRARALHRGAHRAGRRLLDAASGGGARRPGGVRLVPLHRALHHPGDLRHRRGGVGAGGRDAHDGVPCGHHVRGHGRPRVPAARHGRGAHEQVGRRRLRQGFDLHRPHPAQGLPPPRQQARLLLQREGVGRDEQPRAGGALDAGPHGRVPGEPPRKDHFSGVPGGH